MSRDFNSTNDDGAFKRMAYSLKWGQEAYKDPFDIALKDVHFVERLHYGVVDHENNSIIPKDEKLTSVGKGRLLAPVADSLSLMRLNLQAAFQRGIITAEGFSFGTMEVTNTYKDPRLSYAEYLGDILRFYNNTHIPNRIGKGIITHYESYVNNFFNLVLNDIVGTPITLTRWNTSNNSSILNTGLSFSYLDIPMDGDQLKVDSIIDNPNFEYLKNLSINMGFSISNMNPNILVYDISNTTNKGILQLYNSYSLTSFFNNNYYKTYNIDNSILYTYINIFYNKYVQKNSFSRKDEIKCGRVVSSFIKLETIDPQTRPYSDLKEIDMYIRLRNSEEGRPFGEQTIKNIYKKAKYQLKRLDKASAMSYINNEFKDQLWNKPDGYHDLKQKLRNRGL